MIIKYEDNYEEEDDNDDDGNNDGDGDDIDHLAIKYGLG